MRAEISWIAVINGYDNSMVQPTPNPSWAPAWL
jgi:hypothetical protein